MQFIFWIPQLLFSLKSLNQIRFEELSESVRNVWYFANHQVFSGEYSQLGWYAILNIIYKVFGFNIFTVKYFKLVLIFISLWCLYKLLDKYISGLKKYIFMSVIVFSPTYLFFNSLGTFYGIDLVYIPIAVYLIDLKQNIYTGIGIGTVTVLASLSYPTFLYYLPALIYFYYLKNGVRNIYIPLIVGVVVFTSLVFWINNKEVLIYDPNSDGGLFRGAGHLNIQNIETGAVRLKDTVIGFFGGIESYYYEIKHSEFGNISILTILAVIWLTVCHFNKQILVYGLSISVLNVASIFLTIDPSGTSSVRKATGILFSFWVFYLLSLVNIDRIKNSYARVLFWVCLLIYPLTNIFNYYDNIKSLSAVSIRSENNWFENQLGPKRAIDEKLEILNKRDLKLVGIYKNEGEFGYVYNWVYSTLSASCYWNKYKCHDIFGYSIKNRDFIKLNLDNINFTHVKKE